MNALITNVDTGRYDLAALSDDALLAGTRRLVAAANCTLAALLAHLAEVEARGIHRARACSSLYTYCIYELRLSEDAAFRRAKAARLCRRFPALCDAVAAGELHLTGLLMLGPHLTEENSGEVLARARFRTKREIAKLVRELDPLPDVPARVEPLGPELVATPRAPAWAEFAASFNPVRELPPGERPGDWIEGGADKAEGRDAPARGDNTSSSDAPVRGDGADNDLASGGVAPARGAQRYKVQFTASQEYVELLERACDLLSHAVPDRSIAEVNLRALRELVAALEKKKYAATDQPRRRGSDDIEDPRRRGGDKAAAKSSGDDNPRRRGADNTAESPRRADKDPRRRGADNDAASRPRGADAPRRRGIPAAVRRAVRERDGARCTYVDERGQRCRETALLELHHNVPFARGGAATADNLRLRCRAHNALAAEGDFGRTFMHARTPPPGG